METGNEEPPAWTQEQWEKWKATFVVEFSFPQEQKKIEKPGLSVPSQNDS
jgi:hypothetical protein